MNAASAEEDSMISDKYWLDLDKTVLEAMQTLLEFIVNYEPESETSDRADIEIECPNGIYLYFNTYGGLCYNIKEIEWYFEHRYTVDSRHLYTDWDLKSPLATFPVPSPDPYGCPEDTYKETYNMYYGEYGALRKQLAQHCLNKIEELLNAKRE